MKNITNLMRIILIVGLILVIGTTFNFMLFNSFLNGFLGIVFNTLKFSLVIAIIGLWVGCHFILAFISLLFWLVLTGISMFATVNFLSLNLVYENISTFMELSVFFEISPYALIGFAIKENHREK